MLIIMRTMLIGFLRDLHTLFLTIVFPAGLFLGLGWYYSDTDYHAQLLGGVLAMNLLFGATMVTAFNVMAQRNRGVYKLLRATPFSTASFIYAMTGARAVIILLVSGCILLLGAIFFHITLSLTTLLLIVLVLLIGTILFTAVGFIAANLSRDESNVNLISNLISFPMLFASEAFYSLQGAPGWVVAFSRIQPFYYLIEAMKASIDSAYAEVAFPLLMLAIFTVLMLLIAMFTFRWDHEGRRFGRRHAHKPQNL